MNGVVSKKRLFNMKPQTITRTSSFDSSCFSLDIPELESQVARQSQATDAPSMDSPSDKTITASQDLVAQRLYQRLKTRFGQEKPSVPPSQPSTQAAARPDTKNTWSSVKKFITRAIPVACAAGIGCGLLVAVLANWPLGVALVGASLLIAAPAAWDMLAAKSKTVFAAKQQAAKEAKEATDEYETDDQGMLKAELTSGADPFNVFHRQSISSTDSTRS